MKKLSTLLLLVLLALVSANAASLQLPKILGDHMVLQQKSFAKIWGWAEPEQVVKVTTSWNEKTYRVVADITRVLEDLNGSWALCSPETSPSFSAVGYFFGKNLHQELGVPLGLVNTSWGGTPSESWTSKEMLSTFGDFDQQLEELYGTSDAEMEKARKEQSRIEAMIKKQQDFENQENIGLSEGWMNVEFDDASWDLMTSPELREAQFLTLSKVKHSGMAVTMDIGNPNDIHPTNKRDVGNRLALWALAKDYGKELVYSGPLYKEQSIEDNKIRIHFSCTCIGLMDETCPPHINFAAYNQLNVPKEYIVYPYAGHGLPGEYYNPKMDYIKRQFNME